MFQITRVSTVSIAFAAFAAGLSGAEAEDRVSIDDLLPPPGQGAFLSDALYPEMGGPAGAAPMRTGSNSGVALLPAAPATALPFMPHFGFSTSEAGAGTYVDGVFFSPAEGVEVTAKPGLGSGVQGTLGLTVRF